MIRKFANWIVHVLVFFSIFYLLFKGYKFVARDNWFQNLAITTVIQIVFLCILALVSMILTVKLIELSKKGD